MKISKKKYWKEIGKVLEDKSNDYAKSPEEFAHFVDSALKFFWGVHGKGFPNHCTAEGFYKKWMKIKKKSHPGKSQKLLSH